MQDPWGARTPLWAQLVVVWPCIHSTAPAPRCCQCRRAAWRGTVCPAPLPLGTACPIPCSSPHCTPVRVSCAPLPAKARVGPACSALPPPPSPFPFPVPSDAAVVARWLTLPLSSYPPSRHRSRSITEATSACGACTCGGAPPGVPADDVAVGISSCLPPPPSPPPLLPLPPPPAPARGPIASAFLSW